MKRLFSWSKKPSQIADTTEYNHAINIMNTWLQASTELPEQIMLLEYLQTVVKTDLQQDCLTSLLYYTDAYQLHWPFPRVCYAADGSKIEVACTGEKKETDLKNDCIISVPWEYMRMHDNLKNLWKNEFTFRPFNHLSTYFAPIDFCWVHSGLHSIASGAYFKHGTIISDVVHLEILFNHVDTDGVYWINHHNGKRLEKSPDFRISILYEVTRKKYELERKTQ